ncbi:MAG: UDP-glucose/GDP-mannose dehydrogenase family protein [Burkholderiales bacterium]|nr:UDP-glucose/GDP-mannose dehydrogenase family protein [Burkholderiales bacterium]MDE2397787.1 UDP-glucose/GDP-mannose dehydrogenase family protein [Burkholderiales bacterium]MDE2452799.1 UDP-glucose/GDP-mannose dehydrogenase family protein [Burkholderiales bacterium]
MKVTIFGSGYVGLVTAACLAEVGHHILCVDVDRRRIERLGRGEVPIHEPGLDELIARNRAAGRLGFTHDADAGVAHGRVQMIAVGTPPDEDGSADLRHVLAVAETIGARMNDHKVVITKSTVPVGTGDKVRAALAAALARRGVAPGFDLVSNPEFLKEGAAIGDFMKPDRIVVGCDGDQAVPLLRELYEPFNRNRDRLLVMDLRSAELTKYASNAMLATRISFMNELARFAEAAGADIESVRQGMGSDSRIGHAFLYPGLGYGGSCFPKDVKALVRSAAEVGCDAAILKAVEAVNEHQKRRLFAKMTRHFGSLEGRTIALWGLAFKPQTDDMREAPSRVLLECLWQAGARVRAFDPVAMGEARALYGERDDLALCDSAMAALEGCDALAIVTEWPEFRRPDLERMARTLRAPVMFDGRNLFDPATLRGLGWCYYGIGRGETAPSAPRSDEAPLRLAQRQAAAARAPAAERRTERASTDVAPA